MKKHVAVLAALYFVIGVIALLFGAGLFLFGVGGGMLTALFGGDGSGAAGGLLAMFGGGFGAVVAGIGALDLVTAVGLIGRRWYGWILGIAGSILMVLSFNWWSLVGIYGLWVLLSRDGRRVFSVR